MIFGAAAKTKKNGIQKHVCRYASARDEEKKGGIADDQRTHER